MDLSKPAGKQEYINKIMANAFAELQAVVDLKVTHAVIQMEDKENEYVYDEIKEITFGSTKIFEKEIEPLTKDDIIFTTGESYTLYTVINQNANIGFYTKVEIRDCEVVVNDGLQVYTDLVDKGIISVKSSSTGVHYLKLKLNGTYFTFIVVTLPNIFGLQVFDPNIPLDDPVNVEFFKDQSSLLYLEVNHPLRKLTHE